MKVSKLVLALVGMLVATPVLAGIKIVITKSNQTMSVITQDAVYRWPVSTARVGYVTPKGWYKPISLQPMHFSRKYHMSPMPYSIFFKGDYAIHGTNAEGKLGRPASHGCVRLSRKNAATLYGLVQENRGATTIVIKD